MTATENVTATHLRDLFHTQIFTMRQAKSERMHTESMAIQTQLLERLATPHKTHPLRKLMEKDPQFPQFTGRTAHFLAWINECQMRKE